MTATVTFAGDFEAHSLTLESYDSLGFALQLYYLNDGYLEAFFDDPTKMKVADGKATVSHSLAKEELTVTLKEPKAGFSWNDVMEFRASTFNYGSGYSGSCDDSASIMRE